MNHFPCGKLWHFCDNCQTPQHLQLFQARDHPVYTVSSFCDHNQKLEDGLWPASTWMPLPPWRPAVTLTFDRQNLITSSVGASVNIHCQFQQDCLSHSWDINPEEQKDGQPENIKPSTAMSGGESMKMSETNVELQTSLQLTGKRQPVSYTHLTLPTIYSV